MKRSLSFGGLLLLIIGFVGLSGFLTGNLNAWLAGLFSAGTTAKAPAAGVSGASTTLPTVQHQTTGAAA